MTEEVVKGVVNGVKETVPLLTELATDLTTEAINLFIFIGVLGILKAASVFVIYFIIRKYITSVQDVNAENQTLINALKTLLSVISIVIFVCFSYPHLVNIGKALIAPKLFIAEKSAEILNLTKKDK